jgi:hypothetical protein
VHAEPEQVAPGPQTLPHVPQLSASLVTSMQAPLQAICPVGHTHALETQAPPVGHAIPQPPQLFGSLDVSTQPLGQLTRPGRHAQAVTAGVPVVWQAEPDWQTLPQAPQLKSSFVVSTHTPLHSVGSMEGQPQVLEVQTPLIAQALPQAPQSVGLVARS